MDRNINIEEIKSIAADNHLIQESGGKTLCPVCHGDLEHFIDPITEKVSWIHPTQKAHFLSNDKPNKRKFGKIVVEDSLNHTLVCTLKCNNVVQIRNNPVQEQKILLDVLFKYISGDPSVMEIKKLYDAWCYVGKLLVTEEDYKKKYYLVNEYFIVYERSLN